MSRRNPHRPSLAVLACRRPWLAAVGKCDTCGQDLIDVAKRGVHPTPDCDPNDGWWMSAAELAELAALYWPTPNPDSAAQ